MLRKLILGLLFFLSCNIFSQSVDCSQCASKLLNSNDLDKLEMFQLWRLKNEIYARKGYTFSNEKLKDYFNGFAWYHPLDDNNKVKLTDIEIKNVGIIEQAIAERGEFISNAENSKYRCLTTGEVDDIFTERIKKQLGIEYDIWKVYPYSDITGDYYFVMTENPYKEGRSDTGYYYDKIRGINYKREGEQLLKTFELNDYMDKKFNEYDIHFWSRYTLVEDFDGDEIVEPIIIYGTMGMNDYNDNRVRILIYRNNVKTAIRVQNAVTSNFRYLQIDKSFYNLPVAIQDKVRSQLFLMEEKGHCQYPYGWSEAMDRKETMIK